MTIKKAATKRSSESGRSAKPAAQTTAVKESATKSAGKKAAKSSAETYTKPALRDLIKKKVLAGDKGGRAGQWSARKAQLVAQEYAAKGGEYKQERSAAQRSLKKWGDEKWHSADGKEAIQGETTHRYLPDTAWKTLAPADRKATDRKKVAGSRQGKQFVANTPRAAAARKRATKPKR